MKRKTAGYLLMGGIIVLSLVVEALPVRKAGLLLGMLFIYSSIALIREHDREDKKRIKDWWDKHPKAHK